MNYNMKQITKYINESSKVKKFETAIFFKDIVNDVYNTLTNLMFEYNQAGKNVSKADAKKALDYFLEKFYE